MTRFGIHAWSALALISILVSCSAREPAAEVWTSLTELDVADEQRLRAENARDDLAKQLVGELTAAIQEGGPARGIEVCSERAPAIAESIRRTHGVAIGRTSFRQRNAANTPPDWAKAAVVARREKPAFFRADTGHLGALYPIQLAPQCVACHGTVAQIAPEVRAELARLYPDDRATGFAPGDLRGWFWVEVP